LGLKPNQGRQQFDYEFQIPMKLLKPFLDRHDRLLAVDAPLTARNAASRPAGDAGTSPTARRKSFSADR
jgi:hypothetical protein